MRALFILILSTLYMSDINIQSVLGKDINQASFMGVAENNFDDNIYLISNPKVQFLGKPIDQIVIGVNENKTIKRIFIIFPEPIDTSFYKIMSDEYGTDYEVMVIDKTLNEKSSSVEIIDGSFKETLNQITMSLKKGSVEDNFINNILWNKDSFQLMLFFNYHKNRIELHFINK